MKWKVRKKTLFIGKLQRNYADECSRIKLKNREKERQIWKMKKKLTHGILTVNFEKCHSSL